MEDDWETFFQDNDSDNETVKELNIRANKGASIGSASISANKGTNKGANIANNNVSNNDNMDDYDYTMMRERDEIVQEKRAQGQVKQPQGQEKQARTQEQVQAQYTPKCSDIYISTKTKISYFNKPIVLNDVFWKIPVMAYHNQCEGIIKKQIKFNSSTPEELGLIQDKLREYRDSHFIDEHIIMQISNPTGRIKFKDIRKVSIGLRKKDIMSHRCKKKSAFYNCFVVILRIEDENTFREINAKVFNTGKIEIPGIQTKNMLDKVLLLLTRILSKIEGYNDLEFIKDKNETVLINSNFKCGYYVNREKLYNILKFKYNIKCAYDPCSYPGILCEFYYDPLIANDKQTGRVSVANTNVSVANTNVSVANTNVSVANTNVSVATSVNAMKNITKVSFMIFRTGSVLIVGKCEEDVLNHIYLFIKNMLEREYTNCYTILSDDDIDLIKEKEKIAAAALEHNNDKCRKIKKNIIVSVLEGMKIA